MKYLADYYTMLHVSNTKDVSKHEVLDRLLYNITCDNTKRWRNKGEVLDKLLYSITCDNTKSGEVKWYRPWGDSSIIFVSENELFKHHFIYIYMSKQV